MPSAPKRFADLSKSAQNKAKRMWIDSSSDEEVIAPIDEVLPRSEDIVVPSSEHGSEHNSLEVSISDVEDDLPSYAGEPIDDQTDSEQYIESDNEATDYQSNVSDEYHMSDREPGSAFDSDDEEPVNIDCDVQDQPLYEGAPVTMSEVMITILILSLRHNISKALLSDILKMVGTFCPMFNSNSTLYKFHKYFSDSKLPLVRHFYCNQCFGPVESQNSPCLICRARGKLSYFMEVSIKTQLLEFFKRTGFYEMLQHRFARHRQNPNNYEDIYDGAVYKELSEDDGFLANPNNLSFTWYTDGISIFKSSKFSIWPVYLLINELPVSERYKKENILLAALWFGESKPFPNLFLQPLNASLRELRGGINMSIPNVEVPVKVRGIVICVTCDLPAKALFLNMKQYNGRFGCQKCKQEGLYLLDHRVQVYPYEDFDVRTDAETLHHSEQALNFGGVVCGVKGPSILSSMVHQFIRATAVDSMHCVFEGVVKCLLNFWFMPAFSDHSSSLIDYINLVDERLGSFTPPSFVQRLPRSIKAHLAYWKAHELKTWFFYYSTPCVADIMDREYFEHYLLLILGIYHLCQASIDPHSVDIASRALNEFVARYEHLYGLRHMINNLHQLRHLADNVREFGPLWTSSCFPFEDLNGKLKRLVHGSNSAQLQICTAVSTYLNMTTLKNQKLMEGRSVTSFCESLNYKIGRLKRHRIADSIYIIGLCEALLPLPPDIREILVHSNIQDGTNYFSYQRLLKNKIMFCSGDYRRSKRSDSTYAMYSIHGGPSKIGKIRKFIRITDCLCTTMCNCPAQNYCVITRCRVINPFTTCIDNTILSNMYVVTNFEDELVVDIDSLTSVCFRCEVQDTSTTYLVEPVNMLEFE